MFIPIVFSEKFIYIYISENSFLIKDFSKDTNFLMKVIEKHEPENKSPLDPIGEEFLLRCSFL